jgi:hypothetical protein
MRRSLPATETAGFSVDLRRAGATHVVEVGGAVGVLGASLLGSRLLALLNDGAQRLVLDLAGARSVAPGALLATVLRIDRYAGQRGARLVTIAGPDTRPTLETSSARRWLCVVGTREEAEDRLGA